MTRGITVYRAGKYHDAKQWLSYPKIAEHKISHPVSRTYLAMTEFQQGNIEIAQTLLEELKPLVDQLPSQYLTHYNWSNILRAQLALEEATTLIEEKAKPSGLPAS